MNNYSAIFECLSSSLPNAIEHMELINITYVLTFIFGQIDQLLIY